MQSIFAIRPLENGDRAWANEILTRFWGMPDIVSRGKIHDGASLPGYIAEKDGIPAGLLTYDIGSDECEIVTLNSVSKRMGIGSGLIEAVRIMASSRGLRRLWLITTNDNLKALGFYQKRGFKIRAIYPDAIAKSRLIKPEIPLMGIDGIPLRDEIELEMILSTAI